MRSRSIFQLSRFIDSYRDATHEGFLVAQTTRAEGVTLSLVVWQIRALWQPHTIGTVELLCVACHEPTAFRPQYCSRTGFRALRGGTPRGPSLRVGRESGLYAAKFENRIRLLRYKGSADPGPGSTEACPFSGRAAGLQQRLDLSRSERPYPGDRP
jgi:hypothetical protein